MRVWPFAPARRDEGPGVLDAVDLDRFDARGEGIPGRVGKGLFEADDVERYPEAEEVDL